MHFAYHRTVLHNGGLALLRASPSGPRREYHCVASLLQVFSPAFPGLLKQAPRWELPSKKAIVAIPSVVIWKFQGGNAMATAFLRWAGSSFASGIAGAAGGMAFNETLVALGMTQPTTIIIQQLAEISE